MTPETAKEMLYKYDSSCTGCLGFEDFLELLADYQDTLLNRRNEAMEYYEDMQNVHYVFHQYELTKKTHSNTRVFLR